MARALPLPFSWLRSCRPFPPGRASLRRRLMGLLGALVLLTLPLAGCTSGPLRRPLVLYMAISTTDDERVSRELMRTFRMRIDRLVQGFRRAYPHVLVQISIYTEQRLLAEIRARNQSGLGPDLILTGADQANSLLRRGMTLPMPLAAEDERAIDPALLQRVRRTGSEASGLPLGLFTQLACFDRRRVPVAPRDVRELLQLSANGVRVGMALKLRNLFWSAGSLGAVPALRAAAEGRSLDLEQQRGLGRWLSWLQSANVQKDVTFLEDEPSLRDDFRRGLFDWISCGSSDLPALRQALGDNLAISPLPDGVDGQAMPINPLRVLALGRNSSDEQRRMAIALSRFSVRPLVQRAFTMENMVMLPVNRHVTVPVQSSTVLATLVAARRQGEGAAPLLSALQVEDPRVPDLEKVIVSLVYGLIDPDEALEMSLRILARQS